MNIKISAFVASISVLPGCSGRDSCTKNHSTSKEREVIIVTSDSHRSGTSSDIIITEFDQSTGTKYGSCLATWTLDGGGSVNRMHYSVGEHWMESDVMIQLNIYGGDALLMDRVELDWARPFPQGNRLLGDWGSINNKGWCLSNDSSDATAFGNDNYGSTCGRWICFKTGGNWHRGPCVCGSGNSVAPCSMRQSQGEHDECVCPANDFQYTFAARSNNLLRGNTNEE